MASSRSDFKIYLLLVFLILIWGISWPITKIGLQYMPPIWFAAFRMIIGMLCMFVLVISIGKWMIPSRKDMPIILVMGLLQMALFMTLINLGLHYVNAGRSAILVYTTPIWVMPLAILFFKEKATWLKWTGFFLGILGVVTLFSPWGINWSDPQVIFGNGILLLAALCWAIAILCARNMKWHHTPLQLLPWQLLLGTIPVVLIAAFTTPFTVIQWNYTLISILLFIGGLGTAFAYWATLMISKELPSITVSLSFLAVPIAGLIFSAWLLNEPITGAIVVAMILILNGIACVALSGRWKKKEIRLD